MRRCPNVRFRSVEVQKKKKWCASIVFSSQNITRVKVRHVKSKHLSLAEFLVLWSMDRLKWFSPRLNFFDMLLPREVPKKNVPFSNGQPFKMGP